jgi:hypothetical protein
MMSSSTKAQSKQLLGVHAALRSKKPLTPQTLLEMSGCATLRPCADFRMANSPDQYRELACQQRTIEF